MTGRLCSVQALTRFRVIQPQGEFGFVTGHALRVGAAQELLRIGRDTAGIMRAGGWKSVSTLARYLERAEHSVWGG